MKRILLTGMSGTGKSALIAAMRDRGYAAVDMDEPGWSELDEDGNQRWNEPRLQRELDASNAEVLFVSGCADNQVIFYPQFTDVVLLSAPREVIVERLRNRTNNPYGKRTSELREVLGYIETVEPLLRCSATCEIDTAVPFEEVIAKLLLHLSL